MKFELVKQLTNARAPKSDAAEIVTTPTAGNMRMTEKAAERLDVKDEDYVAVVEAKVDGQTAFFICKGWADEERGNFGSKLASANGKVGGSLIFSSSNAYQNLGGNAQTTRHYKLSDQPIENEGIVYYQMIFDREMEKVERERHEKAEVAQA